MSDPISKDDLVNHFDHHGITPNNQTISQMLMRQEHAFEQAQTLGIDFSYYFKVDRFFQNTEMANIQIEILIYWVGIIFGMFIPPLIAKYKITKKEKLQQKEEEIKKREKFKERIASLRTHTFLCGFKSVSSNV